MKIEMRVAPRASGKTSWLLLEALKETIEYDTVIFFTKHRHIHAQDIHAYRELTNNNITFAYDSKSLINMVRGTKNVALFIDEPFLMCDREQTEIIELIQYNPCRFKRVLGIGTRSDRRLFEHFL